MYNNLNLKIGKLVYTGILPNSLSNLTEEQTKIYNDVLTSNLHPEKLIEKYINYSNIKTKQLFILKKIKAKKSQRGHVMVDPNLKPEELTQVALNKRGRKSCRGWRCVSMPISSQD